MNTQEILIIFFSVVTNCAHTTKPRFPAGSKPFEDVVPFRNCLESFSEGGVVWLQVPLQPCWSECRWPLCTCSSSCFIISSSLPRFTHRTTLRLGKIALKKNKVMDNHSSNSFVFLYIYIQVNIFTSTLKNSRRV